MNQVGYIQCLSWDVPTFNMDTWNYQQLCNQMNLPDMNLQAIYGSSTPPSTPVERAPRNSARAVEEKSLACLDCGKPFTRPYNLKLHRQTTHGDYASRPYGCKYSECSRRFMRQADLHRHELSVSVRSFQRIAIADFVLDSLKCSLIRLLTLQLDIHTKGFPEEVSSTQSLLHERGYLRVDLGTCCKTALRAPAARVRNLKAWVSRDCLLGNRPGGRSWLGRGGFRWLSCIIVDRESAVSCILMPA